VVVTRVTPDVEFAAIINAASHFGDFGLFFVSSIKRRSVASRELVGTKPKALDQPPVFAGFLSGFTWGDVGSAFADCLEPVTGLPSD